MNDYVWRSDEGPLTDKTTLPVSELRFGDTGDLSEEGYFTLDPLYCQGDEACKSIITSATDTIGYNKDYEKDHSVLEKFDIFSYFLFPVQTNIEWRLIS